MPLNTNGPSKMSDFSCLCFPDDRSVITTHIHFWLVKPLEKKMEKREEKKRQHFRPNKNKGWGRFITKNIVMQINTDFPSPKSRSLMYSEDRQVKSNLSGVQIPSPTLTHTSTPSPTALGKYTKSLFGFVLKSLFPRPLALKHHEHHGQMKKWCYSQQHMAPLTCFKRHRKKSLKNEEII